MTIRKILQELSSTNQSAVTKDSPAYKKSKKRFKKGVLAKDYEENDKKKRKRTHKRKQT